MTSDSQIRLSILYFETQGNDLLPFLSPEGAIVMQFQGFPQFLDACTCVPSGPVQIFKKAGIEDLDAQWYLRGEKLVDSDVPDQIVDAPRIKDHVCHPPIWRPEHYPLHILAIEDNEIQSLFWSFQKLTFTRLGKSVTVDLSNVEAFQRFTISAEWSPFHIELRVTWLEGNNLEMWYSGKGVTYQELATYSPYQGKVELHQFREREEFDALLMPPPLVKTLWRAAEDSIEKLEKVENPPADPNTPRRAYANEADFLETLHQSFSILIKIMERNKPEAFWDGETPKTEPRAGHALKSFLEAIVAPKNISIGTEITSRSGDLDFLFTAQGVDFSKYSLAAELKLAHSPRIEHGLLKQLPIYMEELDVRHGVYLVIWFKGVGFDNPKDFQSQNDLRQHLESINTNDNVGICILDLSRRPPASRR